MGHEQLIGRIFDEVVNAGNLDAADELMTEDFVDHGPMGRVEGVQAFKDVVAMWRAAVPDVHCEVQNLFSEGDMVAWNVEVTGTHTGEMMGIQPSGKRIHLVSPNIGRVLDGRAAEHWADQSMFQFLVQIGAVPLPGVAA
ncbi:MAG: ester cyclase [Solirubrobacteraceae bacterium]